MQNPLRQQWEEAPMSPSDIQQITAMFQISQGPHLSIPLQSAEQISRGSVIRAVRVHRGQAGMLGDKSGQQKNVCL